MFDRLQSRIYDFLDDANRVLPPDLSFDSSGRFLSGVEKNPAHLFLGINPGHG